MPVNPGIHFQRAQEEYERSGTDESRLKALQKMLTLVPKHKGSESLQKEIKTKIAKLKYAAKKQEARKGSYQKISIKKEGAALIVIVGTTNSGKSTLLSKLTNAKPKIASYKFTTKKPIQGILDYFGIKLQLVEIPAITENFSSTENGPSLLSIIKESDLMILTFNNILERNLLTKELAGIKTPMLIFDKITGFKEKIWSRVNLIKVYTKQPGKEKDFPPVALEKNSNVKNLASKVHKDFVKNFKYAVLNGKSAKFKNQRIGLNHKLKDDDVVEFHSE